MGNGDFTQTGGINSVTTTVDVAGTPGTIGSYSLSGGSLASSELIVGDYGSGTFTQTGGTNSTTTLYLAQETQFSRSSYSLTGGVLLVGSGGIAQGSGAVTFTLGGGTLGASAPWSSSLPMTLNGLGTVDTTGGNISLSGNLSGGGWLRKVGSGSLTLSGSDTYSGGTLLVGGVLAAGTANALSPNSDFTVTGGTLDCSASPQTVQSLTIYGRRVRIWPSATC